MAERQSILASIENDFPQWYQDVLEKAQLADNGPVRGTMVMRPYSYAMWEGMQSAMDARIKATGAENVYLPLFIPQSYLEREAQHVEGFSPELAVVTHAGGKELTEPVVVRPTSETLFGEVMAKWIQSHRDLPMLLNQWANVVRWEMRPRVFLRTTEFLWQEGHTAHATREDAAEYARRIHLDVYKDFLETVLAIPVLPGVKTPSERFAGAINTMTCEAMMGDGKALQMATSHELGQNFANAFGITFSDAEGVAQTAWTTSWGSSTRMMGGLIMSHGDASGLVLPPRIAPHQVVVIVVKDDERTVAAARTIVADLTAAGVRAKLDDRTQTGFGRRATEWELKGVPVRIEVGPRDLDAGQLTFARRDRAGKRQMPVTEAATRVPALLDEIQADLFTAARERLADRTVRVSTIDEAREAARSGFALIDWDALGEAGEKELNRDAITVRCLQTRDGSLPGPHEPEKDLVAVVARAY
ncbi:proline--tRNA ligase [uncultured Microbacterium sp.]|uniref:proline--tRNA ligase n=1 Tax=uncultured Microbacterium sp. TaxID=191216 RepID=UPI0025FEBB9F|nr:proline--tRNA ligase [uncultured Microbacterium sp.]